MSVTYSPIGLYEEFGEDKFLSLIIEDQQLFFELIYDIARQIENKNGCFLVSEDQGMFDLHKKAELITQFIPFTVNRKELLTKVYAYFRQEALNADNYEKTAKILADIENYLYDLTENEDGFVFSVPDNISGLLKCCDFKYDDEDKALPEKISEYICAVNEFMGKDIFITVNLRSYITNEDAERLFSELTLRKISIICIENKEHICLSCENRVIIDGDMCII